MQWIGLKQWLTETSLGIWYEKQQIMGCGFD